MKRATFTFVSLLFTFGLLVQNVLADDSSKNCRCQTPQKCWPSEKEWHELRAQLTGKLVKPTSVLASCRKTSQNADCQNILKDMHNPFYLQARPGEFQSQGWFKAWDPQISEYAVEAQTTQDIVAAVNFARKHNIRIAIKGAGHDYLSRNMAPDSLLIWTHPMRKMTMHDSFMPTNCPKSHQAKPAITVQAGTRWIDAYTEVTTKNKRYMQGGGCTSVGVAGGFTQGGGFGQTSKKFGMGASNILEVEIVTADGKTLIANECQNQDLFWAVRGGGGSTFGVVTQMTLQTFDLPSNFGVLKGKIKAKSDPEYKKLIKHFIGFVNDNLVNEHWGEQIAFKKDNSIELFLFFQDLSKEQVDKIFEPLWQWLKQSQNNITFEQDIFTIPAQSMWDYGYWEKNHPEYVTKDSRADAPKGQYWWTPNTSEVSRYWYTYLSRWLPQTLFTPQKQDVLTDALFKASRLCVVSLHLNKGLAGAPKDAQERSKGTSINPSAHDAVGLVILNKGNSDIFPGINGELDAKEIEKSIKPYREAYEIIKAISPNAGSYANEADYFQKDWQNEFWGTNYSKLYDIKQKYDPEGLFYCHHCVGSEQWDEKGMCKKKA
ncbi:MAG: FAD-binding protein [Candidatus Berkiella sp.]